MRNELEEKRWYVIDNEYLNLPSTEEDIKKLIKETNNY